MAISGEERRELILKAVRETGGTVRLADLARRLGIPTVTVRRDVAALAEAGRVGRSHGFVSYRRSPEESAGESAQPRVVGLLVPSAGSYFDAVIEGARSAADARGVRLVLGIAPYQARDDRAQAERLLESGADGLLLTPNLLPGRPAEEHAWLDSLPVPAVLVERGAPEDGSPGSGLDTVNSDHRHGVFLALRHLAALGHRKVLLAARDDSWTAREVRAGYERAARLLGLEVLPVLDTLDATGRPADPEPLAGRIAEAAADGVRAVLVHNDQDAIQLPPLLRSHGLTVPEGLALIAYDDVFSALADPPLTAVAPPTRAVGETAVDLLLRRLSAGHHLPTHRITLLPSLCVRTSCGG
ncbi:LacI family DNA-binding transcriptional regulator [Streptomyces sp. FH025]|uniref:LacI family DNA-binding transcriptional regulator n=1 Tax=Streptomyces sp. FH025 TaxID=2815937 RepID=UPI001A9DB5A3|nr:LacI family DNA-binding transcriptional regulator [Streptomyces sp. FH025]MBO1413644.1 LacI family DNA-binding transcriptional regulator [Streptomyces sp. FH025]